MQDFQRIHKEWSPKQTYSQLNWYQTKHSPVSSIRYSQLALKETTPWSQDGALSWLSCLGSWNKRTISGISCTPKNDYSWWVEPNPFEKMVKNGFIFPQFWGVNIKNMNSRHSQATFSVVFWVCFFMGGKLWKVLKPLKMNYIWTGSWDTILVWRVTTLAKGKINKCIP